jgi:hypothetical protein
VSENAIRSAADIRSELVVEIVHVLDRPQFHAYGDHADEMLDSILWHLCRVLAYIDGKEREFRDEVQAAHKRAGCDNLPFSTGFRRTKPNCTTSDASSFVIEQWRAVVASINA